MMALLLHMQFPPVYVSWLFVLYNQAISVVHHKNWLSNTLTLSWGVRQGCPLSCHLFNLVGQVLIYSLWDYGYFEWWTFYGDPCSLYVDDIALFLSDLSQLEMVIKHIDWVGHFTGLYLNLSKTIAFDPEIMEPLNRNGIVV